MSLLLKAGLNPNIMDADGYTPLTNACKVENGAFLIDLLMEYGAKHHLPNEPNFKAPLYQCFQSGTIKCLKKLIKYRPDSSYRAHGASPIDAAIK